MHKHMETHDKEDGMTIGGVDGGRSAEGIQKDAVASGMPAQSMGQPPDGGYGGGSLVWWRLGLDSV